MSLGTVSPGKKGKISGMSKMTIPLEMPARAVAFNNGGNVLAVACDGHGSDKVSSLVLFEHLYMETMIEALCMSLNPRLGKNSPMAVLDGSADVLEHIFKLSGKRRLTRSSSAEGHRDKMLSICFGPDDMTIVSGGCFPFHNSESCLSPACKHANHRNHIV